MRKLVLIAVVTLTVLGAALMSGHFSRATAKEPKILEFDTMVGLPSTYTGTQNVIRNIPGGGLPWALASATGELKAGGKLEIEVTGLVFAAGPNTGSNTVTAFRGAVSCLKLDGTVENVFTDPFPATTGTAVSGGGNASIEAVLALPQPCIAPIIFVTSPGRSWFAVTGK